MIEPDEIPKIKETVEELLRKMTITIFSIDLKLSSLNLVRGQGFFEEIQKKQTSSGVKNEDILRPKEDNNTDIIDINIRVQEPQILIGQDGQTLFELQRLLKIILNKKLSRLRKGSLIDSPLGQKNFYLRLDINDYKEKKIEYLKKLAKDLANEVSLTKEKRILSPMPAHERRIVHTELAQRQDIITESQGDGAERCVVISPR